MTDIAEVLVARGKTHGDYADHARITQALKDIMRRAPSYADMNDMEREAVEMILHKLGRIGAGNPHFHDHYLDIAGYATLVADRLETQP